MTNLLSQTMACALNDARERGLDIGTMIIHPDQTVDVLSREQAKKRKSKTRLRMTIIECVYFVSPAPFNEIKIGYATDLFNRLRELQIANPHELHILTAIDGTIALEHRLHAIFATERLRGEWFKTSARIRAFIRWINRGDSIDTALESLGVV